MLSYLERERLSRRDEHPASALRLGIVASNREEDHGRVFRPVDWRKKKFRRLARG